MCQIHENCPINLSSVPFLLACVEKPADDSSQINEQKKTQVLAPALQGGMGPWESFFTVGHSSLKYRAGSGDEIDS